MGSGAQLWLQNFSKDKEMAVSAANKLCKAQDGH